MGPSYSSAWLLELAPNVVRLRAGVDGEPVGVPRAVRVRTMSKAFAAWSEALRTEPLVLTDDGTAGEGTAGQRR